MNTCATCKHWEAPQPIPGMPNVKLAERGRCREVIDDNDRIVVEGHDLDAHTRPDFGCTLWQARDGVLGNMMTDGRSSWPKESK